MVEDYLNENIDELYEKSGGNFSKSQGKSDMLKQMTSNLNAEEYRKN